MTESLSWIKLENVLTLQVGVVIAPGLPELSRVPEIFVFPPPCCVEDPAPAVPVSPLVPSPLPRA